MEREDKFVKVGNLYHLVTSEKFGNIECDERGLTEMQMRDYFQGKALKSNPLAQQYHLKLSNLRSLVSELGEEAQRIMLENEGIVNPESERYNEPFAQIYQKISGLTDFSHH